MPHEKDDEKKGHEPKHDHKHHDHEHQHHHHHHHDHEHGHHHHHGHEPSVPEQHKSRAPRYAKVFLITCSDTRTEATDESGRWLRGELGERGHVLSGSRIVKDEPALIVAALEQAKAAGAQAALINGGTGISSRDSTFEAISAQITRPLPGFGELFRALSYAQIGSAAMLSRAVAGVRADGLIVFAMPGSPSAVRLAAERLIFPELTHLLEELAR
jgi:molybdenum cofactor biosynthesis protein B